MAKYAYNVNKDNKILEVQKQFPGGLKTVDTDDALGKVFLREAENVSLSEFSFLEKRYGTYIKEEFKFQPGEEPNFNNPIQGYFEFTKEDGEVDKILFIGGNAFVKTSDSEVFVRKSLYLTEPGFEYPDPFIYFQVIGGQLLNLTQSVSGTASIVLLGNISKDEQRFETLLDTGTIELSGEITAISDFDGSLSSTGTINLTGNIVATTGNSGPLASNLTLTTVMTSTNEGGLIALSAPANVTVDTSDNHCLYHYVKLENPNNFEVMLQARRSNGDWVNVSTLPANYTVPQFGSGFAIADLSSGPFITRSYQVRFTVSGGQSSSVSYNVVNQSCSTDTGLIPQSATYV